MLQWCTVILYYILLCCISAFQYFTVSLCFTNVFWHCTLSYYAVILYCSVELYWIYCNIVIQYCTLLFHDEIWYYDILLYCSLQKCCTLILHCIELCCNTVLWYCTVFGFALILYHIWHIIVSYYILYTELK